MFHIVNKDGTPVCPEQDKRAAMCEDDFWEYVLNRDVPKMEEDDGGNWEEGVSAAADVCSVCGSIAECGWDAEGRALIHVTEENNE